MAVGFVDEACALVKPPGRPCSIGRLLVDLPDAEADDIADALCDPSLSVQAIWRAMRGRGYPVAGYQQVGHHRAGRCSCGER
jgi:hypothetical protein